MEEKRPSSGHPPPREQALPRTEDDPWVGEDKPWLDEEEHARRWADEDARESDKVVSVFRAVLLSAAVGAAVWALLGYVIYRLVAG